MTGHRLDAPDGREPLRLAVLVSTLTVGGAEQLLLDLLRNLDTARVQPSLYFLKPPGLLGLEALRLGVPYRTSLIRSRFDPIGILRIARLLLAFRADALLLINHRDALAYGVPAAKLAGIPMVINWINETNRTYSHHRLTRVLRRMLHLGVDRVVAAAQGHRAYLSRAERIPLRKITTIYNAVDPKRFESDLDRESARARLGIGPAGPVVGIVAALRPDKAHTVFLKAARTVLQSFPEASFLVVGEGPERDRLVSLTRELDLGSRVQFLGVRRDMGDLFRALDVSTLSSNPEQETLSVAALEAMATGVPVVSTDVGFMREIIIPGTTGFLAEPGNPWDLADKILMLLRDEDLRRRLGETSKAWVRKHFTVQAMAAAFEDLLLEMPREGSGSPSPSQARTRRKTASWSSKTVDNSAPTASCNRSRP